MKKTLSDGREWEGFEPVAYGLFPKGVGELPLDVVSPQDAEAIAGGSIPTTLGGVFVDLLEFVIEHVKLDLEVVKKGKAPLKVLTVRTKSCEQRYSGPSFNLGLLEALIRIRMAGANGFESSWFWYDSDHVTDYPHDSYSFFVVSGDEIVLEQVSFSDCRDSGFDPSVFDRLDTSERAIWSNDGAWQAARVAHSYREFYTKTATGRLMVLRPDEPVLHFYPEARDAWKLPMVLAELQNQIRQLQTWLIILTILGAVAVILLWR